jgi:4a-hydroxytetrahydrobiopterin dehydratase
MRPELLSSEALESGLAALHGDWRVQGGEVVRSVEFPAFMSAVDFINRIAPVAEELDHHPNLALAWRTVTIALSTHSVGGLSQLDLELARRTDAIIDQMS